VQHEATLEEGLEAEKRVSGALMKKWLDREQTLSDWGYSYWVLQRKFEKALKDIRFLNHYIETIKETIKELVGYDIQEYINLDIEKPEFILEKLIKERTINFLFGAKGRGKTEFAMGIMNALTHGAEFLHYKAPYSYPVCYLDGEMDPYDIVERQNAYIKTWSNPPKNYLHVINFAHQIDQHIPDIKDELGQGLILKYLRKQEELVGKKPLLILDNLRSLSNYKENDADSWRPIGVFFKRFKRTWFCVACARPHRESGPRTTGNFIKNRLGKCMPED